MRHLWRRHFHIQTIICSGIVTSLGILSLLSGCSSPRASTETKVDSQAKADQPALSEAELIAIADAEVRKRGWRTFNVEKPDWDGKKWNVYVERLPPVPGGHCFIKIAADGTVLAYGAGM